MGELESLPLMPCHTPSVSATVVNLQTGEVVRHLGPAASAAAARVLCAGAAGQALTWARQDQDWVAETYPLEYRVPADGAAEE